MLVIKIVNTKSKLVRNVTSVNRAYIQSNDSNSTISSNDIVSSTFSIIGFGSYSISSSTSVSSSFFI